ncbi:hypothetical protein NH340_JMT08329 [Sarcoptes scabiei]|nr:hypothetical protein NH340_JMT08329 [Sarcoptes scabiei]
MKMKFQKDETKTNNKQTDRKGFSSLYFVLILNLFEKAKKKKKYPFFLKDINQVFCFPQLLFYFDSKILRLFFFLPTKISFHYGTYFFFYPIFSSSISCPGAQKKKSN